MTAPYLIVNEEGHLKVRLAWFFPDEDEVGGNLGEVTHSESELQTADADDIDSVIAFLTVTKMSGIKQDRNGFYWETEKSAQAVLTIIKAAIAAGADRPIPDWAQKALAAGWKAPKGWKP